MVSMRNKIWLLLVPLLVYSGQYGDAFIQASVPAAYSALGGATVAYHAHTGIGLMNPAVAGWESVRSSGIGYHYQGGLMSNYTLEQRLSVSEKWHSAALWAHVGVDGIQYRPDLISDLPADVRQDSIRNMNGSGWGEFSNREDLGVVTLGTMRHFKIDMGWKYFKIKADMPLGVNIKYLRKSVWDAWANGVGIDVGAQVGMRVVENDVPISNTTYVLGIQLNDILNTPIYWNTKHQDVIARSLRWGAQVSQFYENLNCTVALLYSNYDENGNRHHWGTEIDIAHQIILRTGYFSGRYGVGLGVVLNMWQIDYTFSTSELTAAHRVNLTFRY